MSQPGIPFEPSRTIPDTMLAATTERFGRPEDVVRMRRITTPAPEPGEILIDVAAASVNAADWHWATGLPMFSRIALGFRRPKRSIAGTDVAGTVVALGAGVTTWSLGDRVCGQLEAGGSFAEYALAPADRVVAVPDGVDLETAATLGIAAETALQGLRDWGGLTEGQSVLINGASGGVGTFAVQLARALGAGRIVAVGSTANIETAAGLGADEVIDYTTTDPTGVLTETFDIVFDNVGVWPLRECRRLVGDNGVYVMTTAPKSPWLHPLPRMLATPLYFGATRGKAVAGRTAAYSPEDLRTLLGLAAAGRITPVIERRFPLAEAAEALRLQGEFHARGKSLIIPDPAG
ncbi:NAD(P)-dependent alcohol dehydrogenase [Ammonicoccus fulvus]|uniref:NAD(P)-dependent alcohol dehydrogenase n=1 Tax=Ammonicoccus fulvus TaxID=3138240 RepID=A0ABZ3FRV7_9ACTN